jgi:hypothetical protein
VFITGAVSVVAMVWFVGVGILGDSIGGVFPSPAAISGLVHGLINGWSQILSVPLPVPASAGVLVLPFVLTWVATLFAAEIVIRTRRPVWAIVPLLMSYSVGTFFGVGARGDRLAPAAGVVVGALVLVALTARSANPEQRDVRKAVGRRRLLDMGLALVVVASLAVVVGPRLPLIRHEQPYDPRKTWVPPTQLDNVVTPLEQIDQWSAGTPRALFTDRAPRPLTLQFAVLSTYSPLEGWIDESRYERIGSAVPDEDVSDFVGFVDAGGTSASANRPLQEVTQQVSAKTLPGPWLPVAGRPAEILGIQAFVDPSTDVLITTPNSSGRRQYSVTSLVPPSGQADCSGYDVVPASVGPASPVIAQAAQSMIGTNAPPCAEAEALLRGLEVATKYKFNRAAPSGTNVQVLQNFLSGTQSSSEKGTSEQFAGAFAVMAQALGMDARVVVGFHAGTPIGRDLWQVRTSDAFAWAEVDFQGLGWVGFDPTPVVGITPKPLDEPDKGQSAATPNNSSVNSSQQQFAHLLPHRTRSGSGVADALVVAGSVVGATIAMLGLLIAAVALVRRKRSARRRAERDPRRCVLAAWLSTGDSLTDVGVRGEPSHTPEELAALGSAKLDSIDIDLARLAALVNEALYGLELPAETSVGQAWAHAEQVEDAVRRSMSRVDRFTRSVDIRVLVPRR